MPRINSIPLAARYMILSALGFSFMGMFVKIAYNDGIPVLEIVAFRSLVSALLSFWDVRRRGIPIWGQRKGLLFARGAVGALTLICVYYALTQLPYAEATVLQYLHPMFTAVLALLFLRERVQSSTLVCIAFSLTGLIIIVRPEFLFADFTGQLQQFAVIMAVLGSFGSGVAYVLVRKLSATESPSVIIFYFPIIALPLSLLLLGDNIVIPSGTTWITLICVGIATQVGQLGLTKAMQTETASKATSFSYLQVLFAAILGWVIFDEIPTLWTWAGAALIIVGALINIFWRQKIIEPRGIDKI